MDTYNLPVSPILLDLINQQMEEPYRLEDLLASKPLHVHDASRTNTKVNVKVLKTGEIIPLHFNRIDFPSLLEGAPTKLNMALFKTLDKKEIADKLYSIYGIMISPNDFSITMKKNKWRLIISHYSFEYYGYLLLETSPLHWSEEKLADGLIHASVYSWNLVIPEDALIGYELSTISEVGENKLCSLLHDITGHPWVSQMKPAPFNLYSSVIVENGLHQYSTHQNKRLLRIRLAHFCRNMVGELYLFYPVSTKY